MSARTSMLKIHRLSKHNNKMATKGLKTYYREVSCHKCGFKQFVGVLRFVNFKTCRETIGKSVFASQIKSKKYRSRSRCLKCDAYTLLYLLN